MGLYYIDHVSSMTIMKLLLYRTVIGTSWVILVIHPITSSGLPTLMLSCFCIELLGYHAYVVNKRQFHVPN